MRPAKLACLAVLLPMMGCERPRPVDGIGNVPPSSARVADTPHPADTLRLAEALAVAVRPVDTLTTLGMWMKSHSGDVVSEAVPEGALEGHLCRIATASVDVGRRHMTRSALFNLPNPPAGEMLPADTTRLAEQQCHLRAIWLVAVESDTLRALALADSLGRMLAFTLGASRPGVAMSGRGAGLWKGGRTWTGSGTTVVLGVVPPSPYRTDPDDSHRRAAVDTVLVQVVAFTPNSGFDPFTREMRFIDLDYDEEAERELTLARADSAIRWAGVPRIAADMRAVLARLRAAHATETLTVHTPAIDSAVVRIAVATRDSALLLEPSRRAAALLAADVVLASAAGTLDDVDTLGASYRLRKTLEGVGVPFEDSPLGAVHVYTRPWLWDAYRLDSLGRVGQLAFLTLLSEGWGTRPACEDGADGYNRVIEHGEAALRRGAADPLIHYYVAMAHNDIVALSRGGTYDDYADAKQFVPLAPAARVKALEHFRAALGDGGDRRLRRHAWRAAMSLMLGRSLGARYFCVYD